MADLKKLAEDISKLSLVDAVELKNILKDEYGIEPAAGGPVMVAGTASGGPGGADGAAGGDEKTEFNVILKLWISSCYVFSLSNCYRNCFSNALHSPC